MPKGIKGSGKTPNVELLKEVVAKQVAKRESNLYDLCQSVYLLHKAMGVKNGSGHKTGFFEFMSDLGVTPSYCHYYRSIFRFAQLAQLTDEEVSSMGMCRMMVLASYRKYFDTPDEAMEAYLVAVKAKNVAAVKVALAALTGVVGSLKSKTFVVTVTPREYTQFNALLTKVMVKAEMNLMTDRNAGLLEIMKYYAEQHPELKVKF